MSNISKLNAKQKKIISSLESKYYDMQEQKQIGHKCKCRQKIQRRQASTKLRRPKQDKIK